MTTGYRYRRLDYRDYSAWSLVNELDMQIATCWRLMQESRRRARALAATRNTMSWPYEAERRSAANFRTMLLLVLEIRRAGRS